MKRSLEDINAELAQLSIDMDELGRPEDVILSPIQENIIVGWIEESREETAKINESITFRDERRDLWHSIKYPGGQGLWIAWWASTISGIVTACFGGLASVLSAYAGDHVWHVTLPIAIAGTVLAVLPTSVIATMALFRRIAKRLAAIRNSDQELYDKIERLDNEPAFLVGEIQNYLGGLATSYQQRLSALAADFNDAVIEPRQAAKNKISQLNSDRTTTAADKQLAEAVRDQILTTIDGYIAEYQELVDNTDPRESGAAMALQDVKSQLETFRDEIRSLDSLKSSYQRVDDLFKRLDQHAESIAKIRATRRAMLDGIESRLKNLSGTIQAARGSLGQATAALPGGSITLELTAGPDSSTANEAEMQRYNDRVFGVTRAG